jgi:hypothetical protein
MEKLYFLKHAVATEETGPFNPQIEKVLPELDYNSQESVYRLFDSFYSFPERDPKIDCAILKKGAKITDLLSSTVFSFQGFLINQKLRSVFESFVIPNHRYYKVPIKHGNDIFQYDWLHMLYLHAGLPFNEIEERNIVFDQSNFFIEKHLVKVSDVNVASVQELKEASTSLPLSRSIKASMLTLRSTFLNETPDFFCIPLISNHWIIKEAVRVRIIEKGITGVDIHEIANLNFI